MSYPLLQDQSPKNNAISSINRSSNGGKCDSGAPKPSQVATKNDIPNELTSFKDDAQNNMKASPNGRDLSVLKLNKALAQPCSLSYFQRASQFFPANSRSGWGIPMIGLKGGAGGETSVANGTSGWGPPPTGASASGWGAPPPPNPSASAAWGAPPAGLGSKSPQQGNFLF